MRNEICARYIIAPEGTRNVVDDTKTIGYALRSCLVDVFARFLLPTAWPRLAGHDVRHVHDLRRRRDNGKKLQKCVQSAGSDVLFERPFRVGDLP